MSRIAESTPERHEQKGVTANVQGNVVIYLIWARP